MKSRITGQEIATRRVEIALYQDYIRNYLKPGLHALKQLYYSMKHSSKYTSRGYEAKMLYRQIKMYEEDLAEAKEAIQQLKSDLNNYISMKDKGYHIIRRKRKLNENLKNDLETFVNQE